MIKKYAAEKALKLPKFIGYFIWLIKKVVDFKLFV